MKGLGVGTAVQTRGTWHGDVTVTAITHLWHTGLATPAVRPTVMFLPLSLAALLPFVLADPVHVSIARRSSAARIDYAAAADSLRAKWGYHTSSFSKRQGSADIQITDQVCLPLPRTKFSFYSEPRCALFRCCGHWHPVSRIFSQWILFSFRSAQTLNVILDTGSSDLWVADNSCITCSSSTPVFDPSSSSSSQTATGAGAETTISYGSGAVAGTLSTDTVSMGGFTLDEQVFRASLHLSSLVINTFAVAVDQTTQGLLSGTVSGIMGLAFEAISSTRSTPFWKALVDGNQLTAPEMSFWLARFRGDDDAGSEEPGGTFTLGGTNASLFTGDIEFIDLPVTTPSFWLLRLTCSSSHSSNFAFINPSQR